MVVHCSICNKEFQYPYLLNRHYSNKTPCVRTVINQESINLQEDALNLDKNTLLSDAKREAEEPSPKEYNCMYCSKPSSTSSNNKAHESICKMKDILAVKLELQLKFPIGDYQHTTCKFCDKECSTRSHYWTHVRTCATRKIYERKLLENVQYVDEHKTYIYVFKRRENYEIGVSNYEGLLAKNVRSQNIVLMLPLTNAKNKYKEIQEKYEKRENLDIVYRHEDIQNIVKDIMENDIVCNMENYIYVVKEREFKCENVFKIGRRKNKTLSEKLTYMLCNAM